MEQYQQLSFTQLMAILTSNERSNEERDTAHTILTEREMIRDMNDHKYYDDSLMSSHYCL